VQNCQDGSQNTGHLRTNYNLLYQQGADTLEHSVVGSPGDEVTATRFRGGVSHVSCDPSPRGWIAQNDPWLFDRPGGGFHEGYLYDEMTNAGFELFPPDPEAQEGEDLHSVLTFEQDVDLTAGYVRMYTVALVSSNTGVDDDADILATTGKAWKYAFGWCYVGAPDTALDSAATYSIQYIANGSHEDGIGGGCCGCVFTETSDSGDKFSISGGCEGTIEFAGGDKCGSPYTAQYQLADGCGEQTDVIQISVEVKGECACQCPSQGDYDGDTFPTALDLGLMIDALFSGGDEPKDPSCPTSRGDYDCDCFPTALDLGLMIDQLFSGGDPPCTPCTHDGGSPIDCGL
jgi:hypothetical protein